jgi:hypothetical protein
MAATLIVLAKLFVTALIPTTCSNNFFAAKNTFCATLHFWQRQRQAATIFSLQKTHFAATLRFWQRHMSQPKTIFLVVYVNVSRYRNFIFNILSSS